MPVRKSGEQLHMAFNAFRENRLTFSVKVRGNVTLVEPTAAGDDAAGGGGSGEEAAAFTSLNGSGLGSALGRISFMNEPKVAKGEPALQPLCTLNVALPERVVPASRCGSSGVLVGAGGGSSIGAGSAIGGGSGLVGDLGSEYDDDNLSFGIVGAGGIGAAAAAGGRAAVAAGGSVSSAVSSPVPVQRSLGKRSAERETPDAWQG